MKKLLAFLLTMVMLLTMCVPTIGFADEEVFEIPVEEIVEIEEVVEEEPTEAEEEPTEVGEEPEDEIVEEIVDVQMVYNAATTYTLATSIEDGKDYIFAGQSGNGDKGYLLANATGDAQKVTVTPKPSEAAGSTIATSETSVVWTAHKDGDSFYFTNGSKYLAAASDNKVTTSTEKKTFTVSGTTIQNGSNTLCYGQPASGSTYIFNFNRTGSNSKAVIVYVNGAGEDPQPTQDPGSTIAIEATKNTTTEKSATIAVGETLTISVTHTSGESKNFTNAVLDGTVAEITSGAAITSLAANTPGTVVVEGLKDGKTDITLTGASPSGQGSKYTAIIHLTVGNGGEDPQPTPVPKTTKFTYAEKAGNGGVYAIVSNSYAIGADGNSFVAQKVDVEGNDVFLNSDDLRYAWTVEFSDDAFTLKNAATNTKIKLSKSGSSYQATYTAALDGTGSGLSYDGDTIQSTDSICIYYSTNQNKVSAGSSSSSHGAKLYLMEGVTPVYPTPAPDPDVKITTSKSTATAAATVAVNGQIRVEVTNGGGSAHGYKFSSSDETVATVSKESASISGSAKTTFTVNGLKDGEVTINIEASDGSGYAAVINLTVGKGEPTPTTEPEPTPTTEPEPTPTTEPEPTPTTEPTENKTFTYASSVKTGSTYLLVSNGYALTNGSGTDVSATKVTVTGNTITLDPKSAGYADLLWVAGESSSYTSQGTVTFKNGSEYFARTGGNSNTAGTESSVSAKSVWTYDGSDLSQKNSSGQYTFYATYQNNAFTCNVQQAGSAELKLYALDGAAPQPTATTDPQPTATTDPQPTATAAPASENDYTLTNKFEIGKKYLIVNVNDGAGVALANGTSQNNVRTVAVNVVDGKITADSSMSSAIWQAKETGTTAGLIGLYNGSNVLKVDASSTSSPYIKTGDTSYNKGGFGYTADNHVSYPYGQNPQDYFIGSNGTNSFKASNTESGLGKVYIFVNDSDSPVEPIPTVAPIVDGLYVAFTSDVHNQSGSSSWGGWGGSTTPDASSQRLNTWLDTVSAKIGSAFDDMGITGDLGPASGSDFWDNAAKVMNVVRDNSNVLGNGFFVCGNHEYNPGSYTHDKNDTTRRYSDAGTYKNGNGYVLYSMGARQYNEIYSDADINALTAFLNENAGYRGPIFILAHFPLHYYQGQTSGESETVHDGKPAKGSAKLVEALNTAATTNGQNIFFIWGHNHSSSNDHYDQFYTETLNNKTINFTYCAAGCMADSEYGSSANVKGKGLVAGITNTAVTLTYYTATGSVVNSTTVPLNGGGNPTIKPTAQPTATPVPTATTDPTATPTPSSDDVNVTPPKGSIETINRTIEVGKTFTVNVTNGSEYDAEYTFTITTDKDGIAQLSKESITIAAGATGSFTVTGLKAGSVEITICNNNGDDPQYIRTAVIALTVTGAVSPTTAPTNTPVPTTAPTNTPAPTTAPTLEPDQIVGVWYEPVIIEKKDDTVSIHVTTALQAQYLYMYDYNGNLLHTWKASEEDIDANKFNKEWHLKHSFEYPGDYYLRFIASTDNVTRGDPFDDAPVAHVMRPAVIEAWYNRCIEGEEMEITVTTNLEMTQLNMFLGDTLLDSWNETDENVKITTFSNYKQWEMTHVFDLPGSYDLWYKASIAGEDNFPYNGEDVVVKRPPIIDLWYNHTVTEDPTEITVTTSLEMTKISMYLGDECLDTWNLTDADVKVKDYDNYRQWDMTYVFDYPGKYDLWYQAQAADEEALKYSVPVEIWEKLDS